MFGWIIWIHGVWMLDATWFISWLTNNYFFFLKVGSFAGCSNSKLFDHFVGMGFEVEMVTKAIQEHGKRSVSFDFGTVFFF